MNEVPTIVGAIKELFTERVMEGVGVVQATLEVESPCNKPVYDDDGKIIKFERGQTTIVMTVVMERGK